MKPTLALIVVSVVSLLTVLPGVLSAQTPSTLEVIVFPGGFNWPIWAAQEKGQWPTGKFTGTLLSSTERTASNDRLAVSLDSSHA